MTEELFLKLLMAVFIGGLIGAEREVRTGLGFRTLILICLGSTLFTIYSDIFAVGEGDPRRIAAAVVTGVGFIGGGMILKHQGGLYGLTTAATVWLVAALGMGIGIGQYGLVIVATILVLFVLWAIPLSQTYLNARQTVTYEVLVSLSEQNHDGLLELMHVNHLNISKSTMSKDAIGIHYAWQAYGKPDDHEAAMLALMAQSDVIEFRAV